MDTAGRLLELLALFGARAWWPGAELAERLEVTERTVRRDVTRLRMAGYPIDAVPGPYGGYRLGAGGRLPPLVLDDDEAVAVALALRMVAGSGGTGVESGALTALTKLDQVLPATLRERVAAVRSVTIDLRRRGVPVADVDVLVQVAVACRRPERVRFTYEDGSGRSSSRLVEPFRLVSTDRSWYLVAFDLDRADWRTFRVDRMTEVRPLGVPFEHRGEPDAAALVAEGVAVRAYRVECRVVVHADPRDVARWVAPTTGVVEALDDDRALLRLGGEPDWVARELAGFPCRLEVLDPPELRDELRRLGERLVRDHGAVGDDH